MGTGNRKVCLAGTSEEGEFEARSQIRSI
jgi:hypothetical protein